MTVSKLGIVNFIVAAAVAVGSSIAMAEPGRHWHGDMREFHIHDYPHWREGRWYHGGHDGRLGWWWIAGDMWYFYAAPVYPYPDPYLPPTVAVEPAQVTAVPPPPQNWYYCDSARNYYPYVSNCPEGWRAVPAQPSNPPR
ncbi:MAG TPA: hypothetical protein VGK97_08860 [Spongiibacteraceae bacterium]